jgi:hypothetical protein
VLEPGAVAVGDAFVVEPDRPTNAG